MITDGKGGREPPTNHEATGADQASKKPATNREATGADQTDEIKEGSGARMAAERRFGKPSHLARRFGRPTIGPRGARRRNNLAKVTSLAARLTGLLAAATGTFVALRELVEAVIELFGRL